MLKFSDFGLSYTQVFCSILEVAFSSGYSRWTCSFTINGVHAFQSTKKQNVGFTHASCKVNFSSTEGQALYWSMMTASNVGAQTQALQAKVGGFKIQGFVCRLFLPFFPTPSPVFNLRHFSRCL